uniref:Uncharacterized protein n=1 Tax=Vitis vinifera TaxID=29760 RepID=F6GX04_VITVI
MDVSCILISSYLIASINIGGLAASINSSCVRCGHLGECTIKLGYAHFL